MKRSKPKLSNIQEKRENDRDHYNSFVRRPSKLSPFFLRKAYEPIKKQGA